MPVHDLPVLAIRKTPSKSGGGPRSDVNLQEIRNAEKQLQVAEVEYERLSARLDQVGEPQYVLDLKERIVALNHRIKKMAKNKKTLEVEQIHREKRIGKVIDVGEPEQLQEINQLRTESVVIDKRTRELDENLCHRATALEDHSVRLDAGRGVWKRLCAEAEAAGIKLGAQREDQKMTEAGEKTKTLEAARNGLRKAINLLKTRYNVTLGEYTQKKASAQKQLAALAESLQAKNEYSIERKIRVDCG